MAGGGRCCRASPSPGRTDAVLASFISCCTVFYKHKTTTFITLLAPCACSSPWTTELGKYCAYLFSVFFSVSSRLLGYPCRCVARATLLARSFFLSFFLYFSIRVCARRAAAFVAEGWNEGSKATTIRDRRIRGAPKIQNKSRLSNLSQAKPVHTKRKDERREKKRRLKCSSSCFFPCSFLQNWNAKRYSTLFFSLKVIVKSFDSVQTKMRK